MAQDVTGVAGGGKREERSQGVLKRMEVLELSQTMVGKWTRVGNWRNYFHSLGTFKLSSSFPVPAKSFECEIK